MRYFPIVLSLALLGGCSSSVRTDERGAPISLYRDTRHNLVVNFQPDAQVAASPRWNALMTGWREALREEADSADYQFSVQDGEPRATETLSTLVVIEVGSGHSANNRPRTDEGEWVTSTVRYHDGLTGQLLASRRYDSEAEASGDLFASMGPSQLDAISEQIVEEVAGALLVARPSRPLPSPATPGSPVTPPRSVPAPAAPTAVETVAHASPSRSQEQQLFELQQRNLPYEEYRDEYRRIMGR
ncbi:hypothetical protein H681_01215 [Pseudomonas sp. ATCC 13867]|uniref:hypothetical protein n=1 Tax=Pseudomonas sp. ATCC 13867 TaxID=1294143 RepID=UPI0002C4DEE7|nr:hypothetical protein [Pseudomonas sp. ATCC 13867]AGI22125.1 hypothetical protein H681_01215 [Pseudomonas sp. ATCC 13867]RFQ19773.1 hypothetical protein D0N87_24985 [Pseudomonas sp. ATCC 13867]